MKQINRYFKTDNKALYLSIFGEQTARRQIIMLSGFAEERKSIYRLEVELARSLCDACCIWRFDYSGCGESAGDFQDMSLATWQDDLKVLIKFIRKSGSIDELCLIGFRLGANIAVLADSVDKLVLIEPLQSGDEMINELLRKKHIKAMMSGNDTDFTAEIEASWKADELVDFDGFAVSRTMKESLESIDFAQALSNQQSPYCLVHLSGAKKLKGFWAEQETVERSGCLFKHIRQKPFWGLSEYQENTELKSTIANYLGVKNEITN
ncbi:MAG: hypothetical protein HRT89_19770 [Lentisphaeria bacterium]|nr:hypothetical protein [Lentisphaeria bacterium]NQZ70296.1 hypothetical protein [Lentisphaeria bacterium]